MSGLVVVLAIPRPPHALDNDQERQPAEHEGPGAGFGDDLDLDVAARVMYWTDRGDPPRGNTVNRAPMDAPSGRREDPEIIFNHLMEGIGLALDHNNNRMFMTDLGGSVYSSNLDGSNQKNILIAQGNLSGIAYAEIPAEAKAADHE